MQRTIVRSVVAAAALAALAGAGQAATAINSQAGAWGPNKNPCRATPYFPAGECLSSYFADEQRDLSSEPGPRYRPGHRLTAPTLPDAPWDE